MATLAEIRAQFPQYADLSDSQLADAMHKKFYADMPRAAFYQKVGLKADAPEGRSTAAQIGRAVALPVKGLENSVLETVGAIPDLVSAGFRGLGIPAPAPGAYTQGLKNLLMPGAEKLQPEGDMEKALQGVGQGVGDAASFFVPAAAAGRAAQAGGLTQRVGQALATQPVLQATAGGIGGAVSQASDSPIMGGAAAMAVPLGAAAAQGATTVTKRGLSAIFPQASEQVVNKNIAKTFENVDTGEARKRLADLVDAKEPVSMLQLGDESTKRLARSVAGAPGEGGNIAAARLKEQRLGMSDRVRGDVNRAFKGDEYFAQEDKLLKSLSANANEAYGAFRKQVPYVWSKDMAEMFNGRPSMRDAIGAAMKNAAEEGKPFGITRAKDGKFMTAEDFQKGEGISALTSSAVDDVKKALDGIIDSNRNEFTGGLNKYGALVVKTKEDFLRAVESADKSGLYKAARQQYAGDAEVIQALRDGREFAKMDPREIRQFMTGASFGEKDAFRTGMQDAIEKAVKQTKGDKTKALFRKDEWTDDQLKAALDPKDYKALKQRIDARKQGFEDTTFVSARTGSQTQLRQADDASLENNTLDALAEVAKGSTIRSAIVNKMIDPMQRRLQGVTEQTAPAYARQLFEGNPEKLREFLNALETRRSPIMGGLKGKSYYGPFAGALGSQAKSPIMDWVNE